MDDAARVTLVRHRTGPALAGMVVGIVGMSERAPGVVERLQSAGTLVPLVLSFGQRLDVLELSEGTGGGRSYRSFVAGFSTGWATTRHAGAMDCLQVYLTPLGAERVLGVPGARLARRVEAVDDVVPGLGDDLADRVAAAATWDDRFALVEAALARRAEHGGRAPRWVDGMWHRIQSSGGQVRVSDLVEESGWSHRHVASVFTEHLGVTPKQACDVVRFENASAALGRLPPAEVAATHGYSDQSHLTRDVVRRAGETPASLGRAHRPTPATALGLDGTR